MPDDVPSDVLAVLRQLFDETGTAIRDGEFDTARQTIATAETVGRNKLPEGELRGQVRHGCGEVTVALEPDDGVDADVASEYVRAMAQRLDETAQ